MLEEYTAGFLDADGSVSLNTIMTSSGRKEDWLRIPVVSFYNCDRGILESLQKRWGGQIKTGKPSRMKHSISYTLIVKYTAALDLLKEVFPHMKHSKKKKRAELIINNYEDCTPKNGKYTEVTILKKKWLTEQVMGIVMRGSESWKESASDGNCE